MPSNPTATQAIQDSVANLYIAFFGRAPDAEGFGYWVEEISAGVSPFKTAGDFALSKEWTSNYGGLTPEQQVNLFYQNTFGRNADEAGLNYWVNNIVTGGLPFSSVAYQIINAAYLGGPNVDPNDHALVLHKLEVAEYFAMTLKSNDTTLAATAFTGVTQDPATVQAAEDRLANEGAPTYILTTGTDVITGTNGDDVFQGDAVSTALLSGQTLNNSDNLNGGAGYNVLNAQLSDLYTVPAGLENIQEINLSRVPGLVGGVLPIPTFLDLVNADSVEALGFNGYSSLSGGSQIAVVNVSSEIETINFSNIIGGFGEDAGLFVAVENTGTSLSGEDDTLDLNISNVRAGIALTLDQSQDESYGYETVNIAVSGPTNEATSLNLDDENGTIETVTLSGDVNNFGLTGSGISLDHLLTFDATNFEGDLSIEFTGGAVGEDALPNVTIIGAQGDNVISFVNTNANLDITTFDGDDLIAFPDEDIEDIDGNPIENIISGNVTIDVGAGDNEVDVDTQITGDITVTAGDGDNEIYIDNLIGDATVTAGDGVNEIVVTNAGEDVTISVGTGGSGETEQDVASIEVVGGTGAVSITAGDGVHDVIVAGSLTEDIARTGDVTVVVGTAPADVPEGYNNVVLDGVDGVADITAGDGENILAVIGGGGNVTITAGDGANEIEIAGFDVDSFLTQPRGEGDVFIDVGDGANLVTVSDVNGISDVTAGDGDNDLSVIGGDGDVDITAGAGSNAVVVASTKAETDRAQGDVTVTLKDIVGAINTVQIQDIVGVLAVTAGAGTNDVEVLRVTGAVSVDLGEGANDVSIDDINGDVDVTTVGAGSNTIEVINIDELSTISVTTDAGDDELTLDTARFGDSAGKGTTIDLGEGDNTLTLGGDHNGNISFGPNISNVQNLVITTAVSVPPIPLTVDLGSLNTSLETVTFNKAVEIDAGGSITISSAPTEVTITFDKGAAVDGLFEIQDVETLTLNVGDKSAFAFGSTGTFVGSDLTDLTINLGEGVSSFTGVTASKGTDVNKLETVTVSGGSDALFTMDFDTNQSGAVAEIDLSMFDGDATISVFSVVTAQSFGEIDITLGAGNLVYNITDIVIDPTTLSAEDFVFTDVSLGDGVTAEISGFEIGASATSDDLDLSAFGITKGSDLIISIDSENDAQSGNMLITARGDQFAGEITLVGNFDLADITTVGLYNIIYA